MSQKILSNQDFGGVARAVNHPDPVSVQDVATKAYVDGIVQVITLAAGTYHDVEIDIRARAVEFVPTGDVVVTGFKLVANPLAPGAVGTPGTAPATGNVGGNFAVYKHGFSGRLILANYTGSVAANQIGTPNTIAHVLEQASTGVQIRYTTTYSKWQPVAKHVGQIYVNGAGTLFTRDITNFVPGTGVSLTAGDNATLLATNLTVAINQAAALTWTGAQTFGSSFILGNQQNETAFVAGTPQTLNVTLGANVNKLYVLISGDGELQSVAPAAGNPGAGRVVYCQIVGTGFKRIKHATGASHPTLPGSQASLLCPNNRDLILGNRGSFLLVGDGANGWLVSPISGGDITPPQLAPLDSTLAVVDYKIRIPLPAGASPGTPDDVTVYTAAPYAFALYDQTVLTKTAVAASTGQLRNTPGGLGVALSSVISTGLVGTTRGNAGESFTVAKDAPLYWRRSDQAVVGELFIHAYRI